MKHFLSIFILVTSFYVGSFAQNNKSILIKIVNDYKNKPVLTDNRINLYIYSDNILKNLFSNLHPDTTIKIFGEQGLIYSVSIHRIGYANIDFYWKFDTIGNNIIKTIRLPNLPIQLKDVNIKAQRTSYPKGDTLVIPVDSIKTMPHANSGELLEKIPGVMISSNGNVSMMGKKIDKIKVDGVEVFGGNPKATLENLKANMLKDIEVINLNGNSGKSTELNFKLKKDKKDGIYGEVYSQLGSENRINIGFKVNKIKPSTFLNTFLNYNNQNQQVLSPFDYFQLVGFNMDDNNTLGTQKLYYDYKLEDQFNNLNKIGDLFPFLSKGIHKTFSGGVNLSKTYQKIKWNSYLLGSFDNGNINEYNNTLRSIGNLFSSYIKNTANIYKNHDIIGQSSLKLLINDKNFINTKLVIEQKQIQDNPDEQLTSILLNKTDRLLENSHLNSTQQVTNKNNLYYLSSNWEHRYEKPAEKTTITAGLLANNAEFNETYIIDNKTVIPSQNSNNLIVGTNTNYNYWGNIQHSTPLSRKILIDFRLSALLNNNSVNKTGYDLYANHPLIINPLLSANNFKISNNQTVAQTFLFFKSGNLSAISGLGALQTNWQVSANDTIFNRISNTALLPSFYFNYGFGLSNAMFKFTREQGIPTVDNLLPVIDSSKIEQVTKGNIALGPFLTNQYQFNSNVFINKLGTINFQFNYSVTNNSVSDNYVFGGGLNPLLSYTQLKSVQVITGSIVYVNVDQGRLVNPYIFLFYLWQNQYQFNQQIANQISLNAISSTLGLKMNISKEHKLNLSIQSIINNSNFVSYSGNTTSRFNFELRDDNKIWEGFYYKFSTKWILIYANKTYTSVKPITNFNIFQYFGKKHNWQVNYGITNLFNVDNIKLVNVGINQRTISSYNYLERYAYIGITLYPEKWKK